MRKEWQLHALGDVCKMGSGGTPLTSKREYYNGGTIPWLQSGEVAQGEVWTANNFITQAGFENSAARIFPRDTVLVAMYGATAGQVGILRFEASTNQAVCGIFPNERFHPKFLYYALLSKKDELISRAIGNAQPNISQVKIKNTYVPVPPLSEQKRIVAILDEAFEGIDTVAANAEKNLANARELFKGFLDPIFAPKGQGWVERKLGETFTTVTGNTPPKSISAFYGQFMPLVKPPELCDTCLFSAEDGLSKSGAAVARIAPADSILVSCIGTLGKIGLSRVPVAFNQQINAIFPKEGEALPEFMFYQVLSSSFKGQLEALASGATVAIVNKSKFNRINIALPSIADQKCIILRLDSVSAESKRLEVIYKDKIMALAELKQAVLQKAFAGELTAQPDKALPQAAE